MKSSDEALWSQLAESIIGRLALAMFTAISAARADSVVAGCANDASSAWRRFTPPAKWQLIGIVLIVAVLTHLALLSLQQPSGWWWWAIPGVAGGFGLMLLALSMTARQTGATE